MTEACFLVLPSPRPSFPSRFLIGRPRGEAGAERRREELNGYIWHLIRATPEVAEVGVASGPGCSGAAAGRGGAAEGAESKGNQEATGSSGLPGAAEAEGRGGGSSSGVRPGNQGQDAATHTDARPGRNGAQRKGVF